MGIRITTGDEAVLYDSVSGFAFGPVFSDEYAAEKFQNFANKALENDGTGGDLRTVGDAVLEDLAGRFYRMTDWAEAFAQRYTIDKGIDSIDDDLAGFVAFLTSEAMTPEDARLALLTLGVGPDEVAKVTGEA